MEKTIKQLLRNACPFCHAKVGEGCMRVMERYGTKGLYLSPKYIHSSRNVLNNNGTGEKLKITHLPWPIGRSPV